MQSRLGTDARARRRGRVAADELEVLQLGVSRQGGVIRYLEGGAHGLRSSIFRTEIPPGAGPRPHHHPFDEIFVIEEGIGRYELDNDTVEASAGDIVIVPAGTIHAFVNIGSGRLRHTTLLDGAQRFVELFEGDPRSVDQRG